MDDVAQYRRGDAANQPRRVESHTNATRTMHGTTTIGAPVATLRAKMWVRRTLPRVRSLHAYSNFAATFHTLSHFILTPYHLHSVHTGVYVGFLMWVCTKSAWYAQNHNAKNAFLGLEL